MKENKIQWQPLIEMIIVLVTILGSTIPLYVHMDNKTDQRIEAIRLSVEAIHQDMRLFHAKLERQDAEFKAHLMYSQNMEKK